MRFDLHVHSTYSDGLRSVFELAEEAKESGLAGFALTDHDTVAGWGDIPAAEAASSVLILPGVELSAEWEGRDVHILGYGVKDTAALAETLAKLAAKRRRRIEKMTAKASSLGFEVTFAEVLAKAGEGTVGRPHLAAVLEEKGYVRNQQAAFDRLLNRGKSCYVPRDPFTPEEAVRLIKGCGGSAVLAHPGLDEAFLCLDALIAVGLEGLEASHSAHTPPMAAKFAALAEAKGLYITAGSDYHGFGKGHGQLGSVAVDESTPLPPFLLNELKERKIYVERV